MKQTIILSLGGSIIVPKDIDINFLKNFRKTIISLLKKYRFIIVCGGGKIAREYIDASKKIKMFENQVYDNIGIKATKLNAELIKSVFHEKAYPQVHSNYRQIVRFDKILIAAGFLPGVSTDFDAVMFAHYYKAKTVINLSNIEYVYTKDPNKFKNAKKIRSISWKDFRKIVGSRWKAGMNLPFDPVASKKSEKLKLKVVVMNGRDLNNFKNYLYGKKFKGTVIY